jgi:hypothetical protein
MGDSSYIQGYDVAMIKSSNVYEVEIVDYH